MLMLRKMKLMEHELKLKFPLNKINSFVLVNEFVVVLKVYIWTLSSTNHTPQQINMDIYINMLHVVVDVYW